MPVLASKEDCTGCTACASVCPKGSIAMAPDDNGFSFPVVDAGRCVSCGLCEKACPVLDSLPKSSREPRAYAAYSRDEVMRLDSSSGGIFTELAKHVLHQGGVVFGAAYNEAFEVVHICAEDEAGLAALRGAKYAQSDLNGIFAQVRRRADTGETVLFSGTPCQVAGLKGFLRREYENLVTVDFVCHGVPSPVAWSRYLRYRADQDNEGVMPATVNLRSKETGWSRYQYSNVLEYGNGRRHVASSQDSLYMKLFVDNCLSRVSCTNCRFKGYARCSDLTIGDFWGIWDIRPQMDDNRGTSVVIVQSAAGEALFDRIKERCIFQTVSLEEASAQNRSMLESAPGHASREAILKAVRKGDFERCRSILQSSKPNILNRILRKIRSLV